MKTFFQIELYRGMQYCPKRQKRQLAGFTLVEAMIMTAVFTLTMGAMLSLYVFASRAISGTTSQLALNTQAQVLNLLTKEIKTSVSATIMNYNGTNWNSIAMGQPQLGNALLLSIPIGSFGSTNTQAIYYWVDSGGAMYRSISNSTIRKLWLTSVTNKVIFTLQDYTGTTQISNLVGRTYIDIKLYCLDTNTYNFTQSLTLLSGAEQRN